VKVPASCPTERYADLAVQTRREYARPENQAVLQGWLALMGKVLDPSSRDRKYAWSRVDEVMEYARSRGMKRIGIATCYSLRLEARLLAEILEYRGFEVVSVSCLCGEVDPKEMGLPGPIFCNPILQAEVLAREGAELNVTVGLCVGHDILFLRHSRAETTPLVVKDRSTGHNPVAALYQSQGFFRDRFFGP
jgi:uncharacterized metal-binding protein